ncbi:MAG: polysaccharide deacetylase family protein [Bacteroidales bacterium]|nr:polysaccharide deacetylase family protein [Bacteroidales bacterium]MDD3151628.1 polysaccharide deacetylase family protein [Bacteroidales bacterium]MDD3914185.1 polysaccharide deacetylase family protein [Bacteroidales bacterium]MDD4633720.1 polysaccharide deacetylase family protein [Bacteroidales bacterium]
MLIAFYTSIITKRVRYIFEFMFSQLIISDYQLFDDFDEFERSEGVKFVYDKSPHGDYPFIYEKDIMLNHDIFEVPIVADVVDGVHLIFAHNKSASILNFDPFAASFYMITRYEEYLIHTRDKHHRYNFSNSIAYINGFIDVPIVHLWAKMLENKIISIYPECKFKHPVYRFLPTIDVDLAYEYINKGFVRTNGGVVKSLFSGDFAVFKERIAVILRLKKDPYDTFDHILEIKKKYNLKMVFFFLMASYGEHDKSNLVFNKNFRCLIRHVYDYADVGIHPSYYSMDYPDLIDKEKTILEKILHSKVTKSRQHFLRFEVPSTYQDLSDCEVTEDYSMGYAGSTGFRAGVCVPFKFFNLKTNEETKLTVFPVSVMDATLFNYLKLDYTNALLEITRIANLIKKYNGVFIPLWHNSSLSAKGIWKNRKNLFKELIEIGIDNDNTPKTQ